MKYVLLNQNTVCEVIPEENPIFPGIPIEDRYSAEFLSQCISVEDDVEVYQNWIYQDGTFVAPPEPEVPGEDEENEGVTE